MPQCMRIDTDVAAFIDSRARIYPRPKLLTFDHTYPPASQTLDRPHRTVILYATLNSKNFRELHTYLYSQAGKAIPNVEYVLRYVSPQEPRPSKNYLSGYGVTLDLKKMDYLAVDDRLSSNNGSGQKNGHFSDETVKREADPIIALIQAHSGGESASDAKIPLTEEEIGRMYSPEWLFVNLSLSHQGWVNKRSSSLLNQCLRSPPSHISLRIFRNIHRPSLGMSRYHRKLRASWRPTVRKSNQG